MSELIEPQITYEEVVELFRSIEPIYQRHMTWTSALPQYETDAILAKVEAGRRYRRRYVSRGIAMRRAGVKRS